MAILVSGYNKYRQLFVNSNNKTGYGDSCVCPPRKIDRNFLMVNNISTFSLGTRHSVFVLIDGQAYACGDDTDFKIGTKQRKIYNKEEPENIYLEGNSEKFKEAVCGNDYTLYVTESNKLILCHGKGMAVSLKFDVDPIFISGGFDKMGVIDKNGDFFILTKENLSNTPYKYHFKNLKFKTEIFDICCCQDFIFIVDLNGNVYGSKDIIKESINSNSDEPIYLFSEVPSLRGIKIIQIAGFANHCHAVSEDGRVFSYGKNEYGQLGIGNRCCSKQFEQIKYLKNHRIVQVSAGFDHSLFISAEGKLFSCGNNSSGALFLDIIGSIVLSPVEIKIEGCVTYSWCGSCSSVILVDYSPPKHSGLAFFYGKHNETKEIDIECDTKDDIVSKDGIISTNIDEKVIKIEPKEMDKRERISLISKLKEDSVEKDNAISKLSLQLDFLSKTEKYGLFFEFFKCEPILIFDFNIFNIKIKTIKKKNDTCDLVRYENKYYLLKSNTNMEYIEKMSFVSYLIHPCIVSMRIYSNQKALFHFQKNSFIILSENTDYLKSLSSTQKTMILVDIVLGMRFITHFSGKDFSFKYLNLSNIFFDSNFGHAKICFNDEEHVEFQAPQVLMAKNSNTKYSNKCDVFSFGIIMYYFLMGKLPKYTYEDRINFKSKIKVPSSENDITSSLLNKCLSFDENLRPSFDMILEILWESKFQIFKNVDDLLIIDRIRMIDAYEAKVYK